MAFDLSSISRGRRARPPKIVVYGPPKIGKSTFAASAPGAIGIITEEGLDNIDVPAFPKATHYSQVEEAINTLLTSDHPYNTVFVDSLDWLEPLIHGAICERGGVKNIEDFGYGKGYVMSDDKWREFFAKLDELRDKRNMAIVCIAHERISKIKNPLLADDYDAYALKLEKRALGIVNEWADIIAFAAHETMTRNVAQNQQQQKDIKAVSTGRRMLYLNPHPAYVAGNRYSLPDCELNWSQFQGLLNNALAPKDSQNAAA
ncbi:MULTISPECIES: ATP-binding protein [Comamonas]|uniref:ATP-binding protein n=1 Tax=Comamonas TaxID=283 RepID=UPI0015F9361C|nr:MULTISPECIES: ATP-binding protein [Comamonas]